MIRKSIPCLIIITSMAPYGSNFSSQSKQFIHHNQIDANTSPKTTHNAMATEALGQRRGKNRRHTPAGKMAEALRPAETAHIATPNGPYWRAKQPVLQGKTTAAANHLWHKHIATRPRTHGAYEKPRHTGSRACCRLRPAAACNAPPWRSRSHCHSSSSGCATGHGRKQSRGTSVSNADVPRH